MNYELAKELDNAGFPIRVGNRVGYVQSPQLGELIEACGDRFGSLYRFNDDPEWYAYRAGTRTKEHGEFDGKTPEEAVARLWLALNKKNPL